MFDINGTLPIFIVSFLVFLYLFNEIVLKPVGQVLEKRAGLIQGHLDRAKLAQLEADQLLSKYESDVRAIRSEAQTLIQKAVDEANIERTSALGKAKANGQVKLEEAKAALVAERSAVIDDLVSHEAELVEKITAKVLGEPVSVSLDASQVRRTLEEAH